MDADEDGISASYDRGILTVSVPLAAAEPVEKQVEVHEIAPLDEDDEDFEHGVEEVDHDHEAGQSDGEDQPQHDHGD